MFNVYSLAALALGCVSALLLSRQWSLWPKLQRFLTGEVGADGYPSESRVRLPVCRYDTDADVPSPEAFPRVTTEEFVRARNASRFCFPVIVTDALDSWPALTKWSKDFFAKDYANERATAVGMINNERDKFALPLRIFAAHSHDSSPTHWTYLQDEYFIATHPKLREDISPVPEPLRVDYFQSLPQDLIPESAFLLWGTEYSRSELHVDPYNWTGSNALLAGKKQWKLYPPGQDHLLYPRENALCGSPLNCFKHQSKVDAFEYENGFRNDLRLRFPKFAKARAWTTMQFPGELMLIPPGWFHQVQNEEEALAVASQAWTDDGFETTLEEIAKFPGNAPGLDLAKISHLSRREKLIRLLDAIPPAVVENARRQVDDTHRQIKTSSKKKKKKKRNRKRKRKKKAGR